MLYPAHAPTPDTIKYNDITSKEVACKFLHLSLDLTFTKVVHEFRTVIKEFCNEFEDPKVTDVEDIIKFNEEHEDIAMAERNQSSFH